MKTLIKKIVTKYGAQICSLASLAAIISVNSCRGLYYQPEEPDGVRKIAKKKWFANNDLRTVKIRFYAEWLHIKAGERMYIIKYAESRTPKSVLFIW